MTGASAVARIAVAGEGRNAVAGGSNHLFDRIGAFMTANHLSPDPAHYAFAYRVLSDASSPLAKAVDNLTDGGVRLSSRDIESLGGNIGALGLTDRATAGGGDAQQAAVEGLVAQTQMQVEGFSDMVAAIREEAQGFGRDLAASADAMREAPGEMAIEEIARMTGAMLERVRAAETRLEAATHEASELRDKLEEARGDARRDPLTSLPNRRAFEEAYAAQMASGATTCIAFCDIDHFKLVNDRFGHVIGDRVLKAIGAALVQGCDGHIVARYGGEEFAILFVGVAASEARRILDATRETVAAKRYKLRESDAPLGAVTFSAGIAPAAAEDVLGSVVARADALLYAAKNAGRNCVRPA